MATLIKTVTGVKHDGINQLQKPLVNLLSTWPRRAKTPHMGGVGGFKRTYKELFTKFVNQLELKFEIIQTHMTQKPVLRLEVGACRFAQQSSTAKR